MQDSFIPKTSYGNQFKFPAFRKLVPQSAYISLDGVVFRFGIVAPYLVHKLLFGEYYARVEKKFIQKLKLFICQGDVFPLYWAVKVRCSIENRPITILFSLKIFARLRSASILQINSS